MRSDYQSQLQDKQVVLETLLSPWYSKTLDVLESPPSAYRMRAEFRVWHEGDDTYHIMFDKDTKQKYRVDHFEVASTHIQKAMKEVLTFVKQAPHLRTKLFQIDYLSTTTGELLISLLYHRQLDDAWETSAQALKKHLSTLFPRADVIGRARKQKKIIDRDFVNEQLVVNGQTYVFKQVENSFTQPNAHINVKMIEWVIENTKHLSGDLVELYCGAGNFSIPLSRHFEHVVGTEISKVSVAAAQTNIQENHIDNLQIAKLSAEEFVQAYNGERTFRRLQSIDLTKFQFDTILVDPPRSGLDPATEKLVSQFTNIIYISCNPTTLAENLHVLGQTHEVTHAALFDQFPHTPHIETGVVLTKK